MENIKNFDKLKTEEDKEFVRVWSKITTVTINDDGIYMLDMIPHPILTDAKMLEDTITLSKEELVTFMDDFEQGAGSWSDTSCRICRFIGIDPTDGV